MLAAATCGAVIPASAASAKPPHLAITAIAGESLGGPFCGYNVVVTYSGHAKHGDKVVWDFLHADGSKLFSGSPTPLTLGPSPATGQAIALLDAAPPAGSYVFDVQLLANGTVVSEQRTGTFSFNGLAPPLTCPIVGVLATYP
jgi:hypothetical protein